MTEINTIKRKTFGTGTTKKLARAHLSKAQDENSQVVPPATVVKKENTQGLARSVGHLSVSSKRLQISHVVTVAKYSGRSRMEEGLISSHGSKG